MSHQWALHLFSIAFWNSLSAFPFLHPSISLISHCPPQFALYLHHPVIHFFSFSIISSRHWAPCISIPSYVFPLSLSLWSRLSFPVPLLFQLQLSSLPLCWGWLKIFSFSAVSAVQKSRQWDTPVRKDLSWSLKTVKPHLFVSQCGCLFQLIRSSVISERNSFVSTLLEANIYRWILWLDRKKNNRIFVNGSLSLQPLKCCVKCVTINAAMFSEQFNSILQ